METTQMSSGTPAPYGRACMNCSRAKCRCVLSVTGAGCERCQRLSKECRAAPTVRKRSKRPSGRSTNHREAKLDWVMSAFQNSGVSPGLPPEWDFINPGPSQRDAPSQPAPASSHSSTSVSLPPMSKALYSPQHRSLDGREVSSLIYVPPAMGQQYLDQFRTRNLTYLPFVYIPANMTSDQLRHKYPFFWACIMEVVTFRDQNKGDSFGRITNHIHQRVMVDIAPSMDLLLGVMTFVSWVSQANKRFINIYAHVLMAVVAELGINQSAPDGNSALHSFRIATGLKQSLPTPRTLEEIRAVLGCFLISSRYFPR
ncbi:hypothetical protein N7457_009249 [Penicillium paradoxum]|uniref:uncharacterized protein n=1 Tax=Penicillium paradoxum TaxID=176176 RepID=UPI0025474718|nr:uncharacterized protein N7457_009249 [Penicillium paradoxum]KAJ5774353.1 hypothetical protein N7457_009249 [Penicillium paradoxum]